MPLYTFRCKKCSHEFDEMVSLTKFDEPVVCSKCESTETERLINCNPPSHTSWRHWRLE